MWRSGSIEPGVRKKATGNQQLAIGTSKLAQVFLIANCQLLLFLEFLPEHICQTAVTSPRNRCFNLRLYFFIRPEDCQGHERVFGRLRVPIRQARD